jgi:polysaccharide chain length determinant protein (PEP-CTERM system associated)
MNLALEKAINEVRGAWRFRRYALGAAWLICMIGWLIVIAMPDRYEATARVYVDSRTALKPVLQGLTIEQDMDAQINFVRESLLGRIQLENVARETDMFLGTRTPEERSDVVSGLRQRIVLDVATGGDRGGGAVYRIAYQDGNRDQSLRVVKTLLNDFVESTLGGKRVGSETAQKFLQEQIRDTEQRLSESEARLADFKRKYVGLMPGEEGDYFTRLQNEMDAVKKAQALLAVAMTRREELSRQLRGEAATSSSSRSTVAPMGDTAIRIKEAQAKLDELLLRYTDRHPDVVAARETLEQLQARAAAEMAALRRGDPGALSAAGASANPVFQSIQLQLNQTEVEIAALRSEIGDHQRQVGDLRRLVDTVPEVEAEFKRLNRDYDVIKGQYTSLVERLGKTRLGDEAEAAQSARFDIIDPPSANFEPVAPNRPQLLSIILLVGIAAGGALAFVMHQLRPVFTTTKSLAEITGLPVLGVVSMTWLEKYKAVQRQTMMRYALATGLLVIVFVFVFQFHSAGVALAKRFLG